MNSRTEYLQVQSGEFRLEAYLHFPAGPATASAVVAHPHPIYGGDMSNNVVMTLCNTLTAIGIAALRFNFRGVGRSQGVSTGGMPEISDVRHVAYFLREKFSVLPCLLAGYSFGAWASLQAARDLPDIGGVLAVSPPNAMFAIDHLDTIVAPLYFICGGRDEYCDTTALQQDAARAGKNAPVLIKNADHFWWGLETQLADAIEQGAAKLMQLSR